MSIATQPASRAASCSRVHRETTATAAHAGATWSYASFGVIPQDSVPQTPSGAMALTERWGSSRYVVVDEELSELAPHRLELRREIAQSAHEVREVCDNRAR